MPASFDSLAFDEIPAPDFADVQVVAVPKSQVPLPTDPDVWARAVFAVASAPWWVRAMFHLRQAVVGLIGISKGDQSDFDVSLVRDGEALIRTDQRHLDFCVAVAFDADRRLLRVVTTVRLHGRRGRIYFAPVSILHGPIARSMTRRAALQAARGELAQDADG